jgi:sugar/nucleoside kinase (ribokinase family)
VHTVRTRTKSLLPTDAISVIADAKLTLMAPMAKEDHPFVRQVLDAAPRVVLQLSAQQVQDADAASQLAEDAWLTVINDAELHAWTGLADPVSGVQSLREHGVSNILVTSKRGVLGFVDSNWVAIPSFQTTMVKNTVAAGDVLVGTLAAALVEGHSWKHAIRLGLAAAALHVEGNAAGGDWQALESVLRQRPAISGSQRVTRSASRLRQQVTGAAVTACLLIGISLGLMWWM